jgi:nucleotidyltransferase AbiEii toxin of type IV toxin-antitoxin system
MRPHVVIVERVLAVSHPDDADCGHHHLFGCRSTVPAERFLHPYPDALPECTVVLTWSFEELLAEKTRALLERSRPRDLYHVVHRRENAPSNLNVAEARSVFAENCARKGVSVPWSVELSASSATTPNCGPNAVSMLARQLPALPDLDAMVSRLPAVLGWLDATSKPLRLEYQRGAGVATRPS